MIPIQIALVSESEQVKTGEVNLIAAALQKQVTRDFMPLWNILANVSAFSKLDDVPLGYYRILIKDDIGYAGIPGIHLDNNGQPYALVEANKNTPLMCSHECLEMLADPFGNRFVAAQSLIETQGRVNYLLEICDPCTDSHYAYPVNGLLLSDFYTPNYFDPVHNTATRYSYTGAITRPREVLSGGYLSWQYPATQEWWQATFFGQRIEYVHRKDLPKDANRSWREVIDGGTFEPIRKLAADALLNDRKSNYSSEWALALQADIDMVINRARNQSPTNKQGKA